MSEPAPAGHSRFGASSSERWLECPGSISMSAGMPNESSEYAREGTALHALSAHCLTSGQDAIEWADRPFDYDDHGEPRTIEIDEEQAEAVQTYLDTVRADQEARGGKLLVETRFQLEWLDPEFFGTGDCCRLGADNVLVVYDAKFGKGKPVEVKRPNGKANSQLAYYGIGCVEALRRLVDQFKVDKIELCVVQPRRQHRDGPARRVTVTHAELLELSDELVEAKANALSDNPRFAAGEWCKFCPGAAKCPTLRNAAIEQAQLDFDDEKGVIPKWNGEMTNNPVAFTNEQLAKALDAADIIDAWVGAVRCHAELLANRGEEIPGYKLVDKRATRKWKDEATAAGELSLVFGLDESSIFSKKLLSPAQVEKLLPKPDRASLADLYDKVSSGTKLAHVSDERPAKRAAVQADFDDGKSAPETEW